MVKATYFSFIHGGGGAVKLETVFGDHLVIVASQTKGPRALRREAARRLRKLADKLDADAMTPPTRRRG